MGHALPLPMETAVDTFSIDRSFAIAVRIVKMYKYLRREERIRAAEASAAVGNGDRGIGAGGESGREQAGFHLQTGHLTQRSQRNPILDSPSPRNELPDRERIRIDPRLKQRTAQAADEHHQIQQESSHIEQLTT